MTIGLIGIISLLLIWFNESISQNEKKFDQSIYESLVHVVEQVEKTTLINTFFHSLLLADQLDAKKIGKLLKQELTDRRKIIDFEYGIYSNKDKEHLNYK